MRAMSEGTSWVRVLILSLNVGEVGEVGDLREQVDLKRAPHPV
jgi:hypothetical protein